MAASKNDSIRLSTYEELFSSPPPGGAKTLKKFKSIKRRSIRGGKGSELVGVLQKQRVLVDENAIHFVAEARAGKRADARNSVFKLAQKYQVLPDSERVQKIRQMYGKVKENEDSGDEAWDNASAQLPGKLDGQLFLRLVQKDTGCDHLLDEMEEINQETQELGADVVTSEAIGEAEEIYELDRIIEGSEKTLGTTAEDSHETPEDESELEFDDEDVKTLNSMQREFIGNNLFSWFKDIQKAYESGVKLVKVNLMGFKFIRIVAISNMILTVRQPHTKSQAKLDRQVAVHTIVSVNLGKNSKEFQALEALVESEKESKEFNPKATCCAAISLPKNRSLSLVFLDEDNRNGLVFFLRVLIKRAKAAAVQVSKQG